ncbi:Signal peptidase I [Cronobacter sakazakii 701]|nr:Signal peptidase I [Cronobacter sakazakii 701]
MANMFALILVIATLVTGILWCVDKFIFINPQGFPGGCAGRGRVEESRPETGLAGNRRVDISGSGGGSGCALVYL